MDQLLKIGFQYVSRWTLQGNTLALELNRMSSQRNVLYAFVMDQSGLHVGKTASTFEARLGAYLRPHPTQRTNVRDNHALMQLLRNGKLVDIYGWADSGLHRVSQFHLNYAAGLKDSINQTLSPPWNGVRSTPEPVVASAVAHFPSSRDPVTISVPPAKALRDSAAASDDQVRALEENKILNAPPAFGVRLGQTYFYRGFFNVAVKYSGLFPEHGTEISLYCGDARTLVRAIVDRKANQVAARPVFMGKAR